VNGRRAISAVKYLTACGLALSVLIGPGVSLAQPAAGGDEAPAGAAPAPGGSLPEVGQVLEAVNKATRPEADADDEDWSAPVKLAVVFLGLALLPSALVMMTSFTRIVIVLGFVRRALSTQAIPPTIALIGLALFLTLFTMSPTLATINDTALKPYLADQKTFPEAADTATAALKDFMLRQTRKEDLKLFVDMSGTPLPDRPGDVSAHVVVPAFAISEFRRAFEMGCLLFIPFLLVDLVISAILLSAGMMMLPPAIISLPFKIILFVLVDGWRMLAETLVLSFQGG